MANKGDIYKVALPNGDEYNFKDNKNNLSIKKVKSLVKAFK